MKPGKEEKAADKRMEDEKEWEEEEGKRMEQGKEEEEEAEVKG